MKQTLISERCTPQQLENHLRNNLTYAQIASKCELSTDSVLTLIKEYNLTAIADNRKKMAIDYDYNEILKKIIKLQKENPNITQNKAADMIGVSSYVIRKSIDGSNIKFNTIRENTVPKDIFSEYYHTQQPESISQAARHFNIHRSTVVRLCKEYGIESQYADAKYQPIINALKENNNIISIKELSTQHGLSVSGVTKFIKRNNLEYKTQADHKKEQHQQFIQNMHKYIHDHDGNIIASEMARHFNIPTRTLSTMLEKTENNFKYIDLTRKPKPKQTLDFKSYIVIDGVKTMIIEKTFLINKLNEKHCFKSNLVKELRTSAKTLEQSIKYHNVDYTFNNLDKKIENERAEIKAWLQQNPNRRASDIALHFGKKEHMIRRIIQDVYPEYEFQKKSWFEHINKTKLIQFLEENKPLMKSHIIKHIESQSNRQINHTQLENGLIALNINYSKYIATKQEITYEQIMTKLEQLPKTTPITDIIKHLDMSYSRIHKLLAKKGTSLTQLGYGYYKGVSRKPSKTSFVQWMGRQPDDITLKDIGEYYDVTAPTVAKWLTTWHINLQSLNKGTMRNNPNIFYYQNYTLDVRPNIKVKRTHILTIDKLKYKSCTVMVRDGLNSHIYIINQDGVELMATPKQIIKKYIEQLEKGE